MRIDLYAEDGWLGDAVQFHGSAGKRNPIVHHTERDDLEGKSGNGKIVVTDWLFALFGDALQISRCV